LEIDDEALALIAEFMVAITLTADLSFRLLPHAVTAAARVLFGRDELELARVGVWKEAWNRPPSEDEQDARERAEKEVARFFNAVEGGAADRRMAEAAAA
jgi:hypothetical protein